jgi:GntR family transcriptional repressor for pyruvate dehydrogenase complex
MSQSNSDPTTRNAEPRGAEIATKLREEILRGMYQPGERLPSERDLARQLHVHRSSVREALKKLEQLGLVVIRRGGGARVVPLHDASLDVVGHLLEMDELPDPELVRQLLDVRESLLVGSARFGVERATAEQIDQARELLRRIASPSTGDAEYLAAFSGILQLMAEASRNLVLRIITRSLRMPFLERLGGDRETLRPPRKILVPVADQLEQALGARDALATEACVRELLRVHAEHVLKALERERSRLDEIHTQTGKTR